MNNNTSNAVAERPMLCGEMRVLIGHAVIEKRIRFTDHSPSYYAADYDQLITVPGTYPVYLVFVGGYTCAMPYWCVYGVKCDIHASYRFSGCGGVNFACDVKRGGQRDYVKTNYAYNIPSMVKAGTIRLLPGFEWLADDATRRRPQEENWDWENVKAIGGQWK